MTLVAAVGTFIAGFDGLVAAADQTCRQLALPGFAQIGASAIVPDVMSWQRFLPQERLVAAFARARVVVCHAGMGVVGEAMRAGAPIVLFPRKGTTRRGNPANDQTEFAHTIAKRYGLLVCEDGDTLPALVAEALAGPPRRDYPLGSNVPNILAEWLAASSPASGRDDVTGRQRGHAEQGQ